jgi:hypothetical protein
MVDVKLDGDMVVFEVEGVDKLWALRSRLEIPRAHITRVEHDPTQAQGWWHGLRLGGTNVPGLFTAGTFYSHGELVFWDVRNPDQTIIVSLAHERYKKLILEVADPEAVIQMFDTIPKMSA